MHGYLINNMAFFESLLKTFLDRYSLNFQSSYVLLDKSLNPVYNTGIEGSYDSSFIKGVRDFIPNITQPKLFSRNGNSRFIIPVNILGENEYFIVAESAGITPDTGAEGFSVEDSAVNTLKSINFFHYFLHITIKSICQELQTKEYFRNLSSIIEFEEISHDKELLDNKINNILNSIVILTNSSFAIFHILDNESGKLHISNTAGDLKKDILKFDISMNEGFITNHVWKEKNAIRIKVDEDARPKFSHLDNIEKEKINNYLGIPIKAKDEYFGILELYSKDTDNIYTLEDEYCIQVVANFISIIYKDHILLYQEKHNREQMQKVNKDLKKTQQDLNAFVLRISNLYKINKVIRSVINLDEMIKKLIDVIGKATESDEVFIFLKDENSYELVLQGCPKEYQASVGFVRIPFGKGIEGIVAQTKMSIIVPENVINDPRYDSVLDLELKFFNSLLAAPIMIKDKVIGVLELRNGVKKEYSASEKKLISAITDQLGIAIENALLHKKTELLSLTDDMTSLFNFRFFQQKLKDEIIRSKRYQRDLSILMIDIDHFKKVNDTYGHTKGDFVLRKVSSVITNTVRDVDISSRYGGEEFVVILPETEQRDTMLIAERIRKRVEELDMSDEEGLENLKITISIGVASFPENATTEKSLIEAADKAMYNAKRNGRNRVVGFSSL